MAFCNRRLRNSHQRQNKCGGLQYKPTVSDLSGGLHGLLVLLSEPCEHLSLEATGQSNERQEAEDDQRELPAEVEGHEDGHADVGQRVDDHADLRARGLRRRAEKKSCYSTELDRHMRIPSKIDLKQSKVGFSNIIINCHYIMYHS